MAFHVRLGDPGEDPGCQPLPGGYACPAEPGARVGEAAFAGTSTASLVLEGAGLTQGVREGRFWLGLLGEGLPAGGTLTLKDLRATVVVGF
ncbi:hypothetical protein [Thermus thermamylovorans]|uniref:hypothetical protein n=1 Tax=Thermus thermamylovorans TaxID=2509362 RepID=UPI002ED0A19C